MSVSANIRIVRRDARSEDTRAARRALRLCLIDPGAAAVSLEDTARA